MKGTLGEISAKITTKDWEVGQSKESEEVSNVGRDLHTGSGMEHGILGPDSCPSNA